MSYEIILDEDAELYLVQLPDQLKQFCLEQLDELAKFPTDLSEPSPYPYSEPSQRFRTGCIYNQREWEMVALFKYGQDEATLHIGRISFSEVPPDAEPEFGDGGIH